ncbi:hypothetical protein L226DRAFT_533950 [Lentinus tigrinus ALCF2SS1-7]|uniref:uncharacterized protein n=1 Tax=Lentinus tigrinus ALCF2SS1-7 TaxID=1328758 RepID=UPI00116605CF|nr:hypothetical protein L226DRAFT_533950 [Lentinus tigrinus ALCF2SS1-7]
MSTLEQARWDKDEEEDEDEDMKTFARKFHSGLKLRPESPPDDPDESSHSLVLHCECVVLAELHARFESWSIIPYVGVSKLSCALCQLYFDCYRKATDRTIICTRGTPDQICPWVVPTLADEAADQKVKEVLGRMLKKLIAEAKNARAGKRRCTVVDLEAESLGVFEIERPPRDWDEGFRKEMDKKLAARVAEHRKNQATWAALAAAVEKAQAQAQAEGQTGGV